MSKLIAVGCSHTYGHGLADCYTKKGPGPTASKLAWPNILGELLGKEVINLARPGLSNKGIVHQTVLNQSQITANDIVCIGWTYAERYMVIPRKGMKDIDKCTHMGPWDNVSAPGNKLYYKYLHETSDDLIVLSWYMKFLDLLIKNIGAKVINFSPPHSKPPGSKEFLEVHLDMDNINYCKFNVTDNELDKALDNAHSGPKTHRKFAEDIISEYGDYLK